MNYLNPASFTPDMDFRKNPLQGAVAGMQLSGMQQLLDRSYRDSDQEYLSTLNKYQNDMADNPVKQAKRDTEMGTESQNQKINAAGIPFDDAQEKLTGLRNKNRMEELANQAAETKQKGDFVNTMSQDFQNNPYQALRDGERWKGYVAEGKKMGVTLPDVPTPEVIDAIHQKASAYQQSLPHIQELLKIREQGMNTERVARIGADQRKELGDVKAQNALDVQELKNKAAQAKTESAKKLEEMAVTTLQKVAKGGLSQDDMPAVDQAIEVLTDRQLEKDTGYSIQQLQNATDPAKLDSLRERARAKVAERYFGKKYQGMKDQADLNAMAGGGAAKADTTVTSPKSKAEYDKMPSGTVYIDTDGVKKRKK